jgi:PEP-CTERM motif
MSMHLRTWISLVLVASAAVFASKAASAGFVTILDTDAPAVAAYIAATTEMAIPGPTNSAISSLTGPNLTIDFSPTLLSKKEESWGVWGGGPPIPDVLWTTVFANSVTLDFSPSSTVTTFGFEAEPGPWELHDITAEFFNGASSLGTITFNVDGFGGSRLFAATLDDFGADLTNIEKFTSVVISSNADFALAYLRYTAVANVVPEPASYVMLLGAVAVGLPVLAARRRRKNQRG